MSIYSNVTKQDFINLRKVGEQQKNQRALETKNRILKQTHDIKLSEILSPITNKLDEINHSTKYSGEDIKYSNSLNENYQEKVPVEIDSDVSKGDNIRALPNSSISSELMTNTLGSVMSSSSSL